MTGQPPHVSRTLADRAVQIAYAAIGILLVGAAVLGIAYLVGGSEAVDDNWGGIIFVFAFFASWALSLVACGAALIARRNPSNSRSLVLPLWFFPVYTVGVFLGEFFIFE